MSYFRKTIAVRSEELAFLQAFIHGVTASDSRIVCPTDDLAEQFEDTSNTPHFTLVIDGTVSLQFTRSSDLTNRLDYYTIEESRHRFTAFGLWIGSGAVHYDETYVRTWKCSVMSSEKVLRIDFGSYHTDMTNPDLSVMVIKGENESASAVSVYSSGVTPPAVAGTFYFSDQVPLKKVDRLPYVYQPHQAAEMELIKNKVFVVQDTANRAFATDGLYDIPAVTPNTVLNIGGRSYYSLDAHTLMEV